MSSARGAVFCSRLSSLGNVPGEHTCALVRPATTKKLTVLKIIVSNEQTSALGWSPYRVGLITSENIDRCGLNTFQLLNLNPPDAEHAEVQSTLMSGSHTTRANLGQVRITCVDGDCKELDLSRMPVVLRGNDPTGAPGFAVFCNTQNESLNVTFICKEEDLGPEDYT